MYPSDLPFVGYTASNIIKISIQNDKLNIYKNLIFLSKLFAQL
jgi:hypothetical protein